MKCKIGRFEGYVPDKDLSTIVLNILFLSGFSKEYTFDSPPHKLHKFFYDIKPSYPRIFEDVFFNNDTEFPYSKELEECFTDLQESAFLTRPNPSLERYTIKHELDDYKLNPGDVDYDAIQEIANQFKVTFSGEYEDSCSL